MFDLTIADAFLRDVQRVDRSLDAGSAEGWSVPAVEELMRRLEQTGRVQAAAIRHAAKHEGFVSRAEVYQLGEYDETRTLRGFTRPANRIAQDLRSEGAIPQSAVDVIETMYGSGDVLAKGFRIPQELIPLMNDVDAKPTNASKTVVIAPQIIAATTTHSG